MMYVREIESIRNGSLRVLECCFSFDRVPANMDVVVEFKDLDELLDRTKAMGVGGEVIDLGGAHW